MPAVRPLLPVAFVVVWTSGYVVGALSTQVIDPETVTLWRFVVAAGVMAAIAAVRRESWPPLADAVRFVAIGVLFFGVQFGALYYGLSQGVPAATTALIACTSPLVVASGSSLLGWERLRRVQWAGIALGVVGVVVTLSDRVGRPPHLIDLGWTLLGLVGLAGGTILHGHMPSTAGPRAIGALEVFGGILPLVVLAPLTGSLAIPVTVHGVTTFLWLSIITGIGGPLLMFALIRERGAVATSSLLFVVPALTAFASWPLLDEPVGLTALVGLIVAGIGLLLTIRAPQLSRPDAPSDRPSTPVGPARPTS